MSDQGREFVNRVNEELFNLCGTDHRISSAYHPQSNGLDERMNQTLTRALVKFVNENQNDWDVHIKSILFAYRTSKNDSTKFTPFELMFGRAPVLPIEMAIKSKPSSTDSDSLSGTDEDASSDFDEKVRIMMNVRNQVKAKAMQNINKAQGPTRRGGLWPVCYRFRLRASRWKQPFGRLFWTRKNARAFSEVFRKGSLWTFPAGQSNTKIQQKTKLWH